MNLTNHQTANLRHGSEKGDRKGPGRRSNAEKAREWGCDPLEFLSKQASNENNPIEIRMDAAKAILPYCYARRREETQDGATAMTVILPIEFSASDLVQKRLIHDRQPAEDIDSDTTDPDD